ncbi:hypothetical protein TrVFT333_010904 [Trichoderma virens FT-333]|nr:hypothetical protein TrVFT333_010904 [Trichoderma virens FT-333]
MKFFLSLVIASSLNNVRISRILDLTIFDPPDPRINNWQPAGPDDNKSWALSWSQLPRQSWLLASQWQEHYHNRYCSRGIPGLWSLTRDSELIKLYRLAAFDLRELSNHGVIDHDCSLSRIDIGDGNNNDLNEIIWYAPLENFMNYSIITPQAFRAARTVRNPFGMAVIFRIIDVAHSILYFVPITAHSWWLIGGGYGIK